MWMYSSDNVSEWYAGHVIILTLPVPIPDKENKNNLNFYEVHKTFWGTKKKCEN